MKKDLSRWGGVSSLALLSALLIPAQSAQAHGYLNDPPSRAFQCQKGLNKDCGGAQYEPQSVGETFKGFPAGVGGAPLQGPMDGKIASGGIGLFSAMDAQSANRWYQTEIKDRNINFDWKYTAAHPATKHEYFITRNGWNPNEPLKRASFDGTPFCAVDGGNVLPVSGDKHACVIPQDKSGPHVILGVWTVGDTDAAFYNVVDVNILAEPELPGGWSAVGSIAPSATLLVGDKVKARAFSASGESAAYSVEITIDSVDEGQPQNWSFKLAEKVNQSQTLIQAGIRDEQGNIAPVKGSNNLFAQKDSGVIRYELTLDVKEDTQARMALSAIASEYVLDKGRAKVRFAMIANRDMNVEATLFDANNKSVGTLKALAQGYSNWLEMDVRSEPGTHHMTLLGTTVDGRTTRQDTQPVNLTGEGGAKDYHFVFPEGLASYEAGTRVLHSKTGEVYECKPFPASGYCKQYLPTANGFEPGVGHHWQAAWDQL
ncbi:N-acetylglucosamine-binding protein GbpA [Pseudomonas lactucae]|uniref:N-acetylglucosamine-binding protein GbpA n=1 Tax=Pseudomonas lactucae TaxID=2813360 RepID=A0A9X1C7E6_9PSED|nr:N-acetylglucosamine-binding protein GbpA [Pseudomonas lactucae]MBN2977738.1 N-acetylglucosamine-binding protein GbpA [Pseudomonas lactucae]MBN2985503.1 N-acetylglucosamine-binding protein GbpA [Pseudomonas lactucae]